MAIRKWFGPLFSDLRQTDIQDILYASSNGGLLRNDRYALPYTSNHLKISLASCGRIGHAGGSQLTWQDGTGKPTRS